MTKYCAKCKYMKNLVAIALSKKDWDNIINVVFKADNETNPEEKSVIKFLKAIEKYEKSGSENGK